MFINTKRLSLLLLIFVLCSHSLLAQQPQQAETEAYQQAVTLFKKGLYESSAEEFKYFIEHHPHHPLTSSATYFHVRALSQLNPDRKVAYFQHFVQTNPNTVFAQKLLFDLAYSARTSGNYQKAMRYYKQVLTHNVTNRQKVRAYYWMAETALEMGNLAQAHHYYQQIYKQFPESDWAPKALYAKGRLYLRNKQFEAASNTFELLKQKYPNHPITLRVGTALGETYYQMGEFKKAIQALKESLPYIKEKQKTKAILLIAASYNALGKLDKASTSYRRYINRTEGTPAERAAHYGLGWVYHKRGIYHWAAGEFAKAAKGSGKLARKALYYKAVNEKLAGQYKRSLKTFRTFANKYKSGPWFEKGYYEYAVTAYQMERYGEAIHALLFLIRSDEKLEWKGKIYTLLGQAYFANDEYTRALQAYKAAEQLTNIPADVKRKVRFQKAWLLFSGEAYAKAQKIFESIHEKAPNSELGIKALFWNADSYFNLNRFRAAASRFRQFVQQHPNHKLAGAAMYSLGWSYFKMGQYAKAIEPFKRFLNNYEPPEIALYPYDLDTRLRLGDAYYAMAKYEKAIQTYRQLVGNERGGDYALFQIGNSYYRAEKNYKAVTAFRKLLEMYPNSSLREQAQYNIAYIYLNSGNYEQAIAEFKKVISKFPGTRWAALAQYNIGDAYYNAGQYKKAIAAYKKVLQNYPESEYVLEAANAIDYAQKALNIGAAAQATDDKSALQTFIKNNPEVAKSSNFRYAQAKRFMQIGDYINAVEKLEKIVASKKQNKIQPSVYLDLAASYLQINQTANAVNTYQKVVERYPDSKEATKALIELGNIKANQGRYREAINYYQQAIAAGGSYQVKAQTGWGNALLATNNIQEAVKHYKSALNSNAGYAPAKIGLARAALQQQNFKRATTLLAPIASSNVQAAGAEAQYLLGKIQLKKGNFSKALEAFSKVQVLYKYYDQWVAKAIMGSAKANIQLGNKGRARKLLEELINQYPDTPQARQANQMLEG